MKLRIKSIWRLSVDFWRLLVGLGALGVILSIVANLTVAAEISISNNSIIIWYVEFCKSSLATALVIPFFLWFVFYAVPKGMIIDPIRFGYKKLVHGEGKKCPKCKGYNFKIISTIEIGTTWQYENDDGSRDKRRKNNQIIDIFRQTLECRNCNLPYSVKLAKGQDDQQTTVFPMGQEG